MINMHTDIRPGTAEQFGELLSLDHELAQRHPDLRQLLRNWLDAGSIRVATWGGSPVGYTVVEPSFFGNDFLVLIMVGCEYRNQGVGQLLMGDIEGLERDKKLFTSTNLSNQIMQRLLARRGWMSSGMVFGLDDGDPELFYQYPHVL